MPAAEIAVSEGVVAHAGMARKASFGEFAARAARQAVPSAVPLKDPANFRIVGNERLTRLDAHAKSSGRQQFAIDVMLPGMMTAVVMRPPRFGGKVSSFDASKAKAVPAVVDVVQIPRGVAVVGRDMWSARKGREALSVNWDESAAEKRGTAELMKEYRTIARSKEAVTVAERGDAERALGQARKRVEGEFEFPHLAHAPMEPLTAVCRLSADKCEIWAGCQFHTIDQANAAAAAGPAQVSINTVAAGGTFGRRANPESDYIAESASIAKATGGRYPVRLIWTREDDITGGRYRPLNYHKVTAAIDSDGKVTYRQRIVGQSILAGTPLGSMMKNGVDPTAVGGNAAEQYDLAHAHISWNGPKVGVPVLWWRSVENTHKAFSKEVMIDELAEAAGQDPVAFRLGLLGSLTVRGDTISVDRVVCAVDCGIAVTPDVVKAQMQGSIGYGLSAALYGRITLTDGQVDQSNFHQYQVLRINEMPRVIEVFIVPSGNPPSGVGEPGTPPIAPAVANAVRSATGIRLRSLPFDLAAARKA